MARKNKVGKRALVAGGTLVGVSAVAGTLWRSVLAYHSGERDTPLARLYVRSGLRRVLAAGVRRQAARHALCEQSAETRIRQSSIH